MEVEKIAVIGSGIMGGGIAQVAAESGFFVILHDINDEIVQRGVAIIENRLMENVVKGRLKKEEKEKVFSLINPSAHIEECSEADLIIEAVIENEETKIGIFRRLDEICPAKTVFTSNTSSISISRLAEGTKRPAHFAGMHFMNPAYIMKLVEVIRGEKTSSETIEVITGVVKKMSKVVVVVNDSPGFVANRILMPMVNDAIYALQEGVAEKEGIDTIMKLGANQPMGPLALADLIGLDTCLAIIEVLYSELGEKYKPCDLLKQKVREGKLGRKAGEGFYLYD